MNASNSIPSARTRCLPWTARLRWWIRPDPLNQVAQGPWLQLWDPVVDVPVSAQVWNGHEVYAAADRPETGELHLLLEGGALMTVPAYAHHAPLPAWLPQLKSLFADFDQLAPTAALDAAGLPRTLEQVLGASPWHQSARHFAETLRTSAKTGDAMATWLIAHGPAWVTASSPP